MRILSSACAWGTPRSARRYIHEEAKEASIPAVKERYELVSRLDRRMHVSLAVQNTANATLLGLFRGSADVLGCELYPWLSSNKTRDLRLESASLDALGQAFGADDDTALLTVGPSTSQHLTPTLKNRL